MKALTLWQPWASLVALGMKTIETRSWSTSYRGPLAIHAAKTMPPYGKRYVRGVSLFHEAGQLGGGWRMSVYPKLPGGPSEAGTYGDYRIPLGAVVATCNLMDCLPTHEWPCRCSPRQENYLLAAVGGLGREVLGLYRPDGLAICVTNRNEREHPWVSALPDPYSDPMTKQLPYGDYRCGRWGWLLADIEPLSEPVPARGRQGLWEWSP